MPIALLVCNYVQVLWQMDTILFSLLILRGLCDSQGRVWRCQPNHLYAIEVTLPKERGTPNQDPRAFTSSQDSYLLELLPMVSCLSPCHVVKHISERKPGECIGQQLLL